ncbi:MAG: ribonuclease J [Parcubacteria group bacterium SW_4_49_11]|nr:MAG: ribonuclease J [Parcubacteria group bacterium SW_4_49_11]
MANTHKNTDVRRGATFVRDLSDQSTRYLRAKDPFPEDTKKLRVIPVGGAEELGGRNMTILEYGDDIIVIDMGLQFPEEDQPGIDYLIPNPHYLKGKEHKVRAALITHGHMDHIGGVPHVMSMIGNPPIYATPLTMAIMQRRQAEHTQAPALNAHAVKHEDTIKLGSFKVEFLHVNHSIPDSAALIIHTPEGTILHTGDFKLDHSPLDEKPADMGRFARLGNEGVKMLMADSTSVSKPGHAISETTVQYNIDAIMQQAKAKVIVATFSTMLNRVQQVIKICEKYGRKVVIEGYSMRTNIEIAKELGYASFNPKTVISAKEALRMPAEKVAIVCTGSQGESKAALMRIANKEHKNFTIEKGDTVVFSSSVIPGNESAVQGLKDLIAKQRGRIINYKMMDVHIGGHAPREDLRMFLNVIRPQYLQPIYGDFYSFKLFEQMAVENGMEKDHIILTDNGRVVEAQDGEVRTTTETVPSYNVMVDGLGVGDLREVVIRDRQLLAQDGMMTVIVLVDTQANTLSQDPEIISKGFVHMKTSGELIKDIRKRIKEVVEEKYPEGSELNYEYVKNALREELGLFIYQKTQRRPMILPVVVEV